MNGWPLSLISPMVPAWCTATAEKFDARYVTVKLLQAETGLCWFLAVLTEWAIDNLLDAGALTFQSIPSGGDQHVFCIGSGVVSAVHAGLLVKQVKEVVKVLYSTSLKSFVDVLLCQLV